MSAKTAPLNLILACEGETERRYFNGLFRSTDLLRDNVNIRFARVKGSDLGSLIRAAENERKVVGNIGSVSTWVVCDMDANRQADLNSALNWLGGRPDRGVALTNPCIEQWFLTYLQDKPKQLNSCSDYEDALTQELPGYTKKQKAALPSELVDWDATVQAVNRGWRRLREINVPENASVVSALRSVWRRDNRSMMPLLFSHVAGAVNKRAGKSLITFGD